MNQHQFTSVLAEQRRADLVAAAHHARDYRRAKSARASHTLRLRLRRLRNLRVRSPRVRSLRRPTPRRATPLVQLRDAG